MFDEIESEPATGAMADALAQGDTTPGKPTRELPVGTNPELPPRPKPDESVASFVKALWDETSNLPAFDEACAAAREAQATLFPAWHDTKDKWRGKVPTEKRSRKEDRMVRTPHIYLNQRQAVAQTVPEDHDAQWQPRETVKPRDSDQIAASDEEERFASTIRIGTREYLIEAGLQAWAEAFVQDAKSFPLAVIKLTFQRDWQSDALNGSINSSGDEQDSQARLKLLLEELARGNIDKTDPRYSEIDTLIGTLGGKSELTVFRRLRLSTIPINCFRAPESCRDPLTIYDQPWLSDDTEATAEAIRTKHPFKQKEDGTWTGVHPEDLEIARGAMDANGNRVDTSMRRRSSRRGAARSGAEGEVKPTLVLREVHHRLTNTVYLLCEGVPYPIAKWTPERQHDKWFPYIVVVPNRIPNDLYGISDVELQADIQHRINRKATDEEKARWLGLPRDFFDATSVDEKAIAIAIGEAKPGKATGLPMNGRPIAEFLQRLTYDVNPESFNRTEDFQHLRMAARVAEQSMGVTGRADFAEELKLAREGSAVATLFDQNLYRRVLEDLYDRAAQMLIFELDADDWYEVAGEHAMVPKLASEAEVRQVRRACMQEAQQQARMLVMQEVQGGGLTTPWGTPDTQAIQRRGEELARELCGQLLETRYGPAGLISREGLYRRLRVKVSLSINGSLDRDRRMVAMTRMMEGLSFAADAAAKAGLRFNPKPYVRRMSQLAGEQEGLDAMFDDDPNSLAGALVKMISQGSQLDPAALAALGQVIGPMLAEQAQLAAAGGGGNPAELPQGAQATGDTLQGEPVIEEAVA